MAKSPASFLPLKPVEFLILLSLAQEESHGYRIKRSIEDQTEGAMVLEAGSLYRTIRRLLTDRLIEESTRRPVSDLDDERRRYYRLTVLGKQVAGAEAARLRTLVRAAEDARLLSPLGAT